MDRAQMFEMVKATIVEDIEKKVVPTTVQTFADLHDYGDANEYFLAADGSMLGTLDDYNAIQPLVDAWLSSRHGDPGS